MVIGPATLADASSARFRCDTLGWTEVIHAIHADNRASQRVAERLGSRFLGQAMLPAPLNEPVDIWGQAREE
jgi:RimJ/RimL family protein N-acetyltransferase